MTSAVIKRKVVIVTTANKTGRIFSVGATQQTKGDIYQIISKARTICNELFVMLLKRTHSYWKVHRHTNEWR